MAPLHRRGFLKASFSLAGTAAAGPLAATFAADTPESGATAPQAPGMKLGLVTYLWGESWDLPTVIANCEKAGILGVELRTQHRHGVEPNLGPEKRAEVKKRFADSRVTLVGPGTNECYDHPDPATVEKAIEATKAFVKLSHDCGASGVKVKPNDFHKDVPREKTIAQIAAALTRVGRFAADYGQEIRLEVHGSCGPLPVIRAIMDQVEAQNVGVCWNCNGDELQGKGLEFHFNLVKDRLASTAHVRELNVGDYPYKELIRLLAKRDYRGWILLECRTRPKDAIAALIEQREVFQRMIAG